MRKLFEQTEINGMKLKNRLVRSATWEGMCDKDGKPTPRLEALYVNLAQGGVGLIITGYSFVQPEGKQMPGKMGIHTDDFAKVMKEMVKEVHTEGGRICIQLVHAGGYTTEETIGRQPLAPSEVDAYSGSVPAAMSVGHIRHTVAAFGKAAARARSYGFDAVQLHAAHGYLINQFLSPLTNRRSDDYGGSLDNRCRFLMEVYNSVRTAVGPDFPVLIKLNGSDNMPGGLQLDDAVAAATMLDKAGIDAIEVSGGTPGSGKEGPVRGKINKPEAEGYNLPLAIKVKQAVGCPVMSVGGFRSLEKVTEAIENHVDYVAISRPLIREPNLPLRWHQGDTKPATCISCSKCFLPGIKEGGIYCVQERKKDA